MSSFPRPAFYSKIIAAGVTFSSLHIHLERDFSGLRFGALVPGFVTPGVDIDSEKRTDVQWELPEPQQHSDVRKAG
jgi:hypothetical protein